ncbi:MAG TPA: biotin transporter BioY [Caldisericia bacterium]|nr:biotin transporter BioY [Caldisericia bacterium]HQL66803.1 biotin transporter BioY [Caldisericia bacterium]
MKNIKKITFSSLFIILIIIGSYISIPLPFSPVPLTLQVFFVLLSGILLGSYYGFLSVLGYIILGLLGFPVFAGGQSGFSVFLGPNGGFLLGFLIAPLLMGIVRKNQTFIIPSILLGIFIIHLLGVLYLSFILSIPISKAFYIGSLPFVAVDLIKGSLVYIFSLLILKNKELKTLLFSD